MNKKYIQRHINKPYTAIPNDLIRNPEISGHAKAVFSYMASRPDGWEFHMNEITKHFKEGRDRVYKSITELIENNYIEKKELRDKGQFSTTLYNLHFSPYTDLPDTVLPYTVLPTSNKTDSNKTDNNKYYGDCIESNFETLWINYKPVEMSKGSKQSAKKSYLKALSKNTHDEIMDGTGKYIRCCHAMKTKTKHLSTFLNQEGFNDEWEYQPTKGKQHGKSSIGQQGNELLERIRAGEFSQNPNGNI